MRPDFQAVAAGSSSTKRGSDMVANGLSSIRLPATEARAWPAPSGIRLLIPGYPQWAWYQRDRAFVLLGSYLASVAVGIFTWGTTLGFVVLGFAFATHAFSAADAIRQYAFPGFGRLVPTFTASAGLGTLCYGPALAVASIFACPIASEDRPRDGYLVNRWAYRDGDAPRTGDTVWLRRARGLRPRIARVVAGPDQRVEWAFDRLRVDDRAIAASPFRVAGSPSELQWKVPEGHVLVSFGVDLPDDRAMPGGWEVVDRSDVQGRAWARSYPIWSRKLLR